MTANLRAGEFDVQAGTKTPRKWRAATIAEVDARPIVAVAVCEAQSDSGDEAVPHKSLAGMCDEHTSHSD